jgi:hypothetical protein
MVHLSFIYVAVCTLRSILPRADVQRIVLFDTWFSSVFLGRTVATVAELAFVLQWAIVMHFFGHILNSKFLKTLAPLIMILIFIAEVFSWFAVISTNYIGNTIEESHWAFTYILITAGLVYLLFKVKGYLKGAVAASVVGGVLYVLFMVTVDVPMYLNRWIQNQASNKRYLGFWEGLVDLNTRWIVTHDIAAWKTEIPWMTLYFSFAVLVSISLCYVPMDKRISEVLKNKWPH